MDICNVISSFKEYLPALAVEFENNKKDLKPHQIKTIENVFNRGNTLCIMPTGGGRIFCISRANIERYIFN